jgi:hypothetical protein
MSRMGKMNWTSADVRLARLNSTAMTIAKPSVPLIRMAAMIDLGIAVDGLWISSDNYPSC